MRTANTRRRFTPVLDRLGERIAPSGVGDAPDSTVLDTPAVVSAPPSSVPPTGVKVETLPTDFDPLAPVLIQWTPPPKPAPDSSPITDPLAPVFVPCTPDALSASTS